MAATTHARLALALASTLGLGRPYLYYYSAAATGTNYGGHELSGHLADCAGYNLLAKGGGGGTAGGGRREDMGSEIAIWQ